MVIKRLIINMRLRKRKFSQLLNIIISAYLHGYFNAVTLIWLLGLQHLHLKAPAGSERHDGYAYYCLCNSKALLGVQMSGEQE